jgi:hypothetical protein
LAPISARGFELITLDRTRLDADNQNGFDNGAVSRLKAAHLSNLRLIISDEKCEIPTPTNSFGARL